LQHPQPRQGPTGRFQSRLESEAQHYNDDISPSSQISSQWDNQSTTHGANPAYEGHVSPVTDGRYANGNDEDYDNRSVRSGSSRGPPRPPKIPNDEPLVPQRPPKILASPPPASRQSTYVDHVAAARGGSPAFDKV
jgi:hypothetical protein